MKIILTKLLSASCVLAFAAALVTPAHAARTKPATIIIVNVTPKPLVSGT